MIDRHPSGSSSPCCPGVHSSGYTGRAWYDFGLLDPYTGGGYSYWRVGQYTGFSGYEGVAEGRIHFAGQHRSRTPKGSWKARS